MPEYLLKVFVFGIGACIGSFLNVCIYRLPAGKSVVTPASCCPRCQHRLAPWDNIPLISFLWLRGRCRYCGLGISGRYWLVELITALGALAVYEMAGLTPVALFHFIFMAALIVVVFIDIDHQIIPDVISLPGILIFLVAAILTGRLDWSASLLGIAFGGGSLYLVALAYRLVKGVDGMGGGDIKLLAMIGAWCGMEGVIFTLLIGSVTGTLISLLIIIIYRQNLQYRLPFGPFLSLGAISYVFFGRELITWYFVRLG
ncbi:MAG: prepilin peptidase [Desulfosudaceae bacterium]